MVEAHVPLKHRAIHFLERIGDLSCIARKARDIGGSSERRVTVRFVGRVRRAQERGGGKRRTAGRASGKYRRKRNHHCPFDNGNQNPHHPTPFLGLMILVLSLREMPSRIEMKPTALRTSVL